LSYDPSKINFKRSSKTLKNIEIRLATAEQCSPYKESPILGIDLGENQPMCLTRIGPKMGEKKTKENEGRRETVHVRRSFMYRPSTRFRQLYQERLREKGLDVIMSCIPQRKIGGMEEYLAYMTAVGEDGISNESKLWQFYYRDSWWRRKNWDQRKAQKATVDYAIKTALAMIGLSEDRKYQGPHPPVIGIGLGSFNTKTGLSSKHTVCEKMLIKKVCIQGVTYFLLSFFHIENQGMDNVNPDLLF